VTERNVVSVLFVDDVDRGHCDALLRVEKERGLGILQIHFYKQTLPKAFYLGRRSILIF
jgi:hypothetical protein